MQRAAPTFIDFHTMEKHLMLENKPAENPLLTVEEFNEIPMVVTAARWLFVLLGVIWLVFGVWSITLTGSDSSSGPAVMFWIIAISMFKYAFLLIWIGWGIGRGNNLYYYFGLLMLAGNLFLTFADEFESFDLVTLIINIALLALLIATRAKYLEN